MALILTVIGFGTLIFLHELGHYLAARAVGMRVLSFSIGFGPALWQRRIGDTLYKVSIIPLGGYVMVDGGIGEEETAQQSDHDAEKSPEDTAQGMAPGQTPVDDPRRYENRPAWAKLAYIFAGPAMNWLTAVVLASMVLWLGMPKPVFDKALIGRVEPTSAAAKGGMKKGDQVIAVGDKAVSDWAGMVAALDGTAEKATAIRVMRQGHALTLTITPAQGSGQRGVLGVMPGQVYEKGLPLVQAMLKGPQMTVEKSAAWLNQMTALFSGRSHGRMVGVPGIFRIIFRSANEGAANYLFILFTLSLGLAFLNLMPIPALDGGRLLLLGVGVVLRGRLTPRIESLIHLVGIVVVFGSVIWFSVRDIVDIFKGIFAG